MCMGMMYAESVGQRSKPAPAHVHGDGVSQDILVSCSGSLPTTATPERPVPLVGVVMNLLQCSCDGNHTRRIADVPQNAATDDARILVRRLPLDLTVGFVSGGTPIDGFDLGNSPAALCGINLTRRAVV